MEYPAKQPAAAAARRSPPAKRDRLTSAAEVRELLAVLHNKDPHQVMGAVTESSLTQGIVLATLGTILLMLACTAGPYAWGIYFGNHVPAAAPPAETGGQTATAEHTASAPAASTAAPPVNDAAVAAQLRTPEAAASKKVLQGVSEVKQSDPNVNPLDSKVDDLFDKAR